MQRHHISLSPRGRGRGPSRSGGKVRGPSSAITRRLATLSLPAMAKISAGILLYRRRGNALEVFLVHPGGPFWAKRDEGAWSIPKGEAEAGEDLLARAKTEFQEETGFAPPRELRALAAVKQAGGKARPPLSGASEGGTGGAHK